MHCQKLEYTQEKYLSTPTPVFRGCVKPGPGSWSPLQFLEQQTYFFRLPMKDDDGVWERKKSASGVCLHLESASRSLGSTRARWTSALYQNCNTNNDCEPSKRPPSKATARWRTVKSLFSIGDDTELIDLGSRLWRKAASYRLFTYKIPY